MSWQDAVRPVRVSIEQRSETNVAVVAVAGEIDLSAHLQLREVLHRLVDQDRHLIVDLTDVDFLDSTGLGLFVGVLKRMRERGDRLRTEPAQLVLVISSPAVWRTLGVTNLDAVFTVVDRLEDAESPV